MNFTHVQYRVVHLAADVVHMDYVEVLHSAPRHHPNPQPLPHRLKMYIDSEYILFIQQPQRVSSAQQASQSLGLNSSRSQESDDWLTVRQANQRRQQEDDTHSEDSDARKHTKTTYLHAIVPGRWRTWIFWQQLHVQKYYPRPFQIRQQ